MAPTIKKPPRIVSIVNKKVTMECIIVSTSKPACHWERNTTKVKMDSRHGVSVNEVGMHLKSDVETLTVVQDPCTISDNNMKYLESADIIYNKITRYVGTLYVNSPIYCKGKIKDTSQIF